MHDNARYAVGVDVGTTNVRAVVAHLDPTTGVPTIVGTGVAASSGMRKGEVVKLDGPAKAIDDALGEAERASGHQVNSAAITLNGTHILSTRAEGMIAVGGANHEIIEEDLNRLEEVATVGKIPPNRRVLDVVPHAYRLDDQGGIKDPLGMTGTRLELDAHVVSVLVPQLENLEKTTELAKVSPSQIATPNMAAARAVLSEAQLENGVGLIDIGGATTNIAVYEEGDLQFTAVLGVGGVNITNDLAIGLKVDPEIAEKIKLQHALASKRSEHETLSIKSGGEEVSFNTRDVDDIVSARLEEIFESIQRVLKKVGYAEKLPSGVVLVGGTAQLKGLVELAKESLGVAARIGKADDFGGVDEAAKGPEYAVAVGLMLLDSEAESSTRRSGGSSSLRQAGTGAVGRVLAIFKKAFGGSK